MDSLNNARREASRYFTNKEKNHLKDKTDELEKSSKTKNVTDFCRASMTLRRVASLELIQ